MCGFDTEIILMYCRRINLRATIMHINTYDYYCYWRYLLLVGLVVAPVPRVAAGRMNEKIQSPFNSGLDASALGSVDTADLESE